MIIITLLAINIYYKRLLIIKSNRVNLLYLLTIFTEIVIYFKMIKRLLLIKWILLV